MKIQGCVISLIFELSFFPVLFAAGDHDLACTLPDSLRNKENISMLVIDSGLGGLSVCADVEARVKLGSPFKKVNMVFCNALPESNYGYNDMASMAEKAQVFSDALKGMVGKFKPDVILIACNTLSVVYPHTEFSRSTHLPVFEIISIAAEMIAQRMRALPDAAVLLFGTETTIASDAHRTQLMALGIDEKRILTQVCPKLETEIQTDLKSDLVKTYVEMYVDEAAGALQRKDVPVFAGLCCTHYGYVSELFQQAMCLTGIVHGEILNPNSRMAQLIFLHEEQGKLKNTEITVHVSSRATISKEEIHSITAFLQKQADSTAHALAVYELDRNLFPFERAHP